MPVCFRVDSQEFMKISSTKSVRYRTFSVREWTGELAVNLLGHYTDMTLKFIFSDILFMAT